jgi:hypothetical protein
MVDFHLFSFLIFIYKCVPFVNTKSWVKEGERKHNITSDALQKSFYFLTSIQLHPPSGSLSLGRLACRSFGQAGEMNGQLRQ